MATNSIFNTAPITRGQQFMTNLNNQPAVKPATPPTKPATTGTTSGAGATSNPNFYDHPGSMWGGNGPINASSLNHNDQMYLGAMMHLPGMSGAISNMVGGSNTAVRNAVDGINATNPAALNGYNFNSYNGPLKQQFANYFAQHGGMPNVPGGFQDPITGKYSTAGLPGIFQSYFNQNPDQLQRFQNGGTHAMVPGTTVMSNLSSNPSVAGSTPAAGGTPPPSDPNNPYGAGYTGFGNSSLTGPGPTNNTTAATQPTNTIPTTSTQNNGSGGAQVTPYGNGGGANTNYYAGTPQGQSTAPVARVRNQVPAAPPPTMTTQPVMPRLRSTVVPAAPVRYGTLYQNKR